MSKVIRAPCQHHRPLSRDMDYCAHSELLERRMLKGIQQRQCPECMRWYYSDEFGRGWSKGIKEKRKTFRGGES